MVVNTDTMMIDIDKVSCTHREDSTFGEIVVDGVKLVLEHEDFEVVRKAFTWTHKSYTYDKNLKKIK
jgi:hypothetical protein